jgi:hypothetical protein
VAPTDTYVMIGGETYAGNNFPAGTSNRVLGDVQSLYVKLGGDVGASNAWRRACPGPGKRNRQTDVPAATTTRSTAIPICCWRFPEVGAECNATQRNFKFRAATLRDESGDVAVDNAGNSAMMDYSGKQWGWYAQGSKFMAHWRAGLRYDRLSADNNLNVTSLGGFATNADVIDASGLDNDGHHPQRWTAMLDWSPSEFSRLRLQYDRDESRINEVDNQWMLQYIMSSARTARQF